MVNNTSKVITIGHLYPKVMNVYGDMGNVITLRYRLEKRGYKVAYVPLDTLSDFAGGDIDILVGGGGQDSNQDLIQADLLKYAKELRAACNDGLVCIMICGMYQLFGERFVLADGKAIPGASILPLETRAGGGRLIGTVVVDSMFGQLVGFENHSGRTYLGAGLSPLGRVIKGAGNNGDDGHEGVVSGNIFGTYMHGPALAKNPRLADELIGRALARRGLSGELKELDDFFERRAAQIASARPR